MKKLYLGASALVLALAFAGEAAADCNGMYLAGRGGVAKHEYSQSGDITERFNTDGLDKNRLMLSGALGYRYNYFRSEIEYVYRDKSQRKYSIAGGTNKYNFKSYSLMLNGYIDLAPYSWFTPFISGGIGFSTLKYSAIDTNALGESVSETGNGNYNPTRFTWSVGGGLTVKVTNRFNVDAGYRYYDMNSIRHADITAHEIYGGIRYVF